MAWGNHSAPPAGMGQHTAAKREWRCLMRWTAPLRALIRHPGRGNCTARPSGDKDKQQLPPSPLLQRRAAEGSGRVPRPPRPCPGTARSPPVPPGKAAAAAYLLPPAAAAAPSRTFARGGAGQGRAGVPPPQVRTAPAPPLQPLPGASSRTARGPVPGSRLSLLRAPPHVGIHDQDTHTPHSYLHLNGVKAGEDLPCQGIYGLERAIQPHPPQQTPLSGRGGGSQGNLSTVPRAKCQASARGLGLSPSPLAARCRPYPAWTHATALSVPQKTRP